MHGGKRVNNPMPGGLRQRHNKLAVGMHSNSRLAVGALKTPHKCNPAPGVLKTSSRDGACKLQCNSKAVGVFRTPRSRDGTPRPQRNSNNSNLPGALNNSSLPGAHQAQA